MKRFLSILCTLAVLSSLFILPGAAAFAQVRKKRTIEKERLLS